MTPLVCRLFCVLIITEMFVILSQDFQLCAHLAVQPPACKKVRRIDIRTRVMDHIHHMDYEAESDFISMMLKFSANKVA